jgi:uncharacterized damage-inducible protein DinB
MLPEPYRQLVQHMEWADAVTWAAVLATPAAHESEAMRTRLHHVHLVQHLYLQIWTGETPRMQEASEFADLEALHAWARSLHPRALRVLDGWGDAELAREIAFPWAQHLSARFGRVHAATVGESIVQLASHTTHHRGQVAAHLRELGGEPPLADFIAWVWRGKPAAEWTQEAAA